MSNENQDPEHEEEEAKATGTADSEAEKTAESETAEQEPEDAEARAARLEAEVADLRDQLLRALAEAENQRRRSQREREDAVRYAAAPMLRDLLAVADNLQRALESVPEDKAGQTGALKTLLEGVQMTERELQSVFERHGIVKLDPMGERLNPHHHEAMFEVPDTEQPGGTIVQVVQPGYLLHDRLLRPARVGVAKGGPATKPVAEPNDEAEPAGSEGEAAEPSAPNGSAPGSRIDTSA